MNYLKHILLFCIITSLASASAVAFASQTIPKVVIISPSNNSSNSQTSSVNSKIITQNDINNSSAQSLDEVIQGNMGVQVNDLYGDGNNSTFSMRGFGDNASSNTLILLNGIPLENPDLGSIAINFIEPENVDHIEVIPSSSSVEYGDQAVGGILNIVTAQPQGKNASVNLKYGSFNSKLFDAKISNKLANNLDYLINMSHYDTDNYRKHNNFQNNNFNAHFNYHSLNSTGYLHFWNINKHLLFPGALTKEQENQDRRQAVDNLAYNNQDNNLLQAGYKIYIYDNYNFQLNALAQQMHGHGAYTITNSENIQEPSNFKEKRQVLTLLPTISGISTLFNHTIKPLAGMEISRGSYDYDSDFHDSSSTQMQQALYANTNFYITPKWSILFGGRIAKADYDLQETNNPYSHQSGISANADNLSAKNITTTHPTNNASATTIESKYAINHDLNLFVKRATNYRFPKTDEEIWTVNGEPLKTQTGVSYETGVNLQKKIFSFLLDVYRLDLDNEIMTVPDPSSNYFNYYNENLDPTKRVGIIVDNNLKINNFWKINLDYSLVDAKFNSGIYSGNRIPFVPTNILRFTNTFSISNNWICYLESIYSGNKYAANDLENRGDLIGGITLFNAALSYNKANYKISTRINNLFNKHYDSYVVSTYEDDKVMTSYYPAAGINWIINLAIKI